MRCKGFLGSRDEYLTSPSFQCSMNVAQAPCIVTGIPLCLYIQTFLTFRLVTQFYIRPSPWNAFYAEGSDTRELFPLSGVVCSSQIFKVGMPGGNQKHQKERWRRRTECSVARASTVWLQTCDSASTTTLGAVSKCSASCDFFSFIVHVQWFV